MRRVITKTAGCCLILFAAENAALAQELTVGIEQRVPWTTSNISGSPEPPLPYVTERVFPNLTFNQCLDISAEPGTNRLFVIEQAGKIFSFPDRPEIAKADLVVDFATAIPGVKQVYSIAFHPNYEQNRLCYVCYIKAAELPDGTHVARFRMNDTDPPTLDVASETTLVTWTSGGHNGCCLKFGPDGYLYISTGDATAPNPPDGLKTGQDVGDLLSSILRIDVDRTDEGLNYSIPADNPFVNLEGARGEVWAYGLRNPWRMSFDRKTGDFWVGDVGWELWEMLYRVERGGNYGWAVMEGRQSTNPEWPRGPTPILPPTIDHQHTESSSITDGLTYYGTRLAELKGTHIYGDYDTGKVWGFRYENGKVVDHRELADTTLRIVTFGESHAGEFYLLDHPAGTIHRLIANSNTDQSNTFPRTLSKSGLYASVSEQVPAPGVIPYSINAQPWADHAIAQRLLAIPNELTIKAGGTAWTFPKDSVLVKTLSLDMTTGEPATRRLVETQILHFDGTEWMPYTYQWNDDQTDATLVDAAGAERELEVVDENAAGGKRKQTWRFSGRAECQRCHNKWSGPALAFNTAQLNKNHGYDGVTAPQLDTLAHIRLIENLEPAKKRAGLAAPYDPAQNLDERARAYLHTNCAHCHRMHAGGSVLSQMQFDLPIDKTNMLGARPSQGTFNIHDAHVVAAGDPYRSVLFYRMSKLGNGRMPHIGSTEVDRAGTELIYNWISEMQPVSDVASTVSQTTANLRQQEKAALAEWQLTKTIPEQIEQVDRLLASTTGALLLLHAIDQDELPESQKSLAIEKASSHSNVSIRDLFERFLTPDQRIKRLGSVVQPEQILSLSGDAGRGKQIFFETSGISCKNCHQVKEQGADVGPELSRIGKKLSRAQLLESILEPSKRIEPAFITYLVETDEGQVLTGLLIENRDSEVVLKDAQKNVKRIPRKSIEQLVPQRQSLMPDLLVRDMTAQQVADLLAYLGSLQ